MSRNKFKFRREIIAAGGITSTGGLQITAASTFDAQVTFAARPVFSAGVKEPIQSLTGAAACSPASTGGTAILGYGITVIDALSSQTTQVNFIYKLNSPAAAGVNKEIYFTGSSASTKVVSIRTATSTHVFYGSTKNSVAYTTTVNNLGYGFPILLRGLSTTQWALKGLPGVPSTASALAGATA
jgi:hypothetical protein